MREAVTRFIGHKGEAHLKYLKPMQCLLVLANILHGCAALDLLSFVVPDRPRDGWRLRWYLRHLRFDQWWRRSQGCRQVKCPSQGLAHNPDLHSLYYNLLLTTSWIFSRLWWDVRNGVPKSEVYLARNRWLPVQERVKGKGGEGSFSGMTIVVVLFRRSSSRGRTYLISARHFARSSELPNKARMNPRSSSAVSTSSLACTRSQTKKKTADPVVTKWDHGL